MMKVFLFISLLLHSTLAQKAPDPPAKKWMTLSGNICFSFLYFF